MFPDINKARTTLRCLSTLDNISDIQGVPQWVYLDNTAVCEARWTQNRRSLERGLISPHRKTRVRTFQKYCPRFCEVRRTEDKFRLALHSPIVVESTTEVLSTIQNGVTAIFNRSPNRAGCDSQYRLKVNVGWQVFGWVQKTFCQLLLGWRLLPWHSVCRN